ncbi:hypothetical protein [Bosea lathyri]|uniref:Uncharacterized protein n=1 Tax=Bosea lathyri TaxID=1036778 RepID=A0A1H6BKH1_9HYPH|nr:hypothetical protein [Bosea lathyri]SEG61190.1 hypothetical protein SAMN04488115_107316 [Bosea lathyri]
MTSNTTTSPTPEERASALCAQLRMLGSPTISTHLGERQGGTIFWERDGWPFVKAAIAKAFREIEGAPSK